tara:strand:+ start:2283 stop:2696 length:414 start_codon:yes stop_codon:yes gene_type:complete
MDYTIMDDNNSTNINYDDLLQSVNTTINNTNNHTINNTINNTNNHTNNHTNNQNYNSNYQAQLVNYSLNYTVKDLKRISKYYKLNIRKKVKDDLIYSILSFETNIDNNAVVSKRKELWYYLQQLLEDSFFNRYIYLD